MQYPNTKTKYETSLPGTSDTIDYNNKWNQLHKLQNLLFGSFFFKEHKKSFKFSIKKQEAGPATFPIPQKESTTPSSLCSSTSKLYLCGEGVEHLYLL